MWAFGAIRYLSLILTIGGHSYADFGATNAIAVAADMIHDFYKIDTNTPGNFGCEGFLYKHVPTSKSVLISTMSFGNNVFGNGVSAFVLEDEPYLRKLGVAGVIGGVLFRNVVLTIDRKRNKISTSMPSRPSYMK